MPNRNYFRNPIRLGDSLATASGGGRNANVTNIIASTGNFLESGGSIFLNRNTRAVLTSSITVGVSGTDTSITAIRVYTATLGSGSIAGASIIQSSYTVTGLTTGDKIIAMIPPNSGISSGGAASLLGIAYYGVSAADTLFVGWNNVLANANVHTTGDYTIVALRS